MPTTSALAPCRIGCGLASCIVVPRSARQQPLGVAGDHQLLVGRERPRRDPASRRADARATVAVRALVELEAEPAGAAADAGPDLPRVPPYPRREDDRVEAAQRRRQ